MHFRSNRLSGIAPFSGLFGTERNGNHDHSVRPGKRLHSGRDSGRFEAGLRIKYEAMLRAIPTDVALDPERVYVYKYVARGLIDNPVYETQKQR